MKFVIFGLTVTSSWGNGHATLWRGLLKALAARGHTALFFEQDVPYYANARDGWQSPAGVEVYLYRSVAEVEQVARAALRDADVGMVTSYCGEGAAAAQLVLQSGARTRTFFDLDTPVTLQALSQGETVSYLPSNGLGDFDLVLSYTGGRALDELRQQLGARQVAPLYGWVDPDVHRPTAPVEEFRCDLGYLGTYAADRQAALEELFVHTARALPSQRFVIGGAMYPDAFPWAENIFFVRHLPPELHPAFFCSSRLTLNVTRQAMARYGFCPSGRLFEAAACGTPIVTDLWEGLDTFFDLHTEILPASQQQDVTRALQRSDADLRTVATAARLRVLRDHTAAVRAVELEAILDDVGSGARKQQRLFAGA